MSDPVGAMILTAGALYIATALLIFAILVWKSRKLYRTVAQPAAHLPWEQGVAGSSFRLDIFRDAR